MHHIPLARYQKLHKYLASRLSLDMPPSLFQVVGLDGLGPASRGCLGWVISGLSWMITVLLSSRSPRTSRLSVSLSSFLGGGGSFLLESLKFLGYLSKPGSSLRAVGRVFFPSLWPTKRSRLLIIQNKEHRSWKIFTRPYSSNFICITHNYSFCKN